MKIVHAEEKSTKFGVSLPSGPSDCGRLLARCYDIHPTFLMSEARRRPVQRDSIDFPRDFVVPDLDVRT